MNKLLVSLATGAAVLVAPLATVQAQAQDAGGPRVFTRTGQWALDAGEDTCRLARNFTNGTDTVSLALERVQAENTARLILVGDALRVYRSADEIGYRYSPSGDQRTARFLRSETPDGQDYFNLGTIFVGPNPFAMMDVGGPGGPGAGAPADGSAAGPFVVPPYNRAAELEYAAGITGIEFNEGLTEGILLQTGSLRGPMEALQACADDLLRTWGLDWEKHRTMTRRAAPAGPAHEWVPQTIVGFRDFGSLGGARNLFRVMVSAEGRPTDCVVQSPSLDEGKNRQICAAIMENGSFVPALDAEGQPMASYWMTEYLFGLARPFGR